jgi:hypothetical protein
VLELDRDLDRLRWSPPSRREAIPKARPEPIPRHRPGEKFIKGPIPLRWVEAAGCQPGRALHVGLALWYRAGLENSRRVSLNLSRLEPLGVTRYAASRGLKALEAAGLVQVDRGQGRKAIVVLNDGPQEATGG